jgi:Mce-associated membrane protein
MPSPSQLSRRRRRARATEPPVTERPGADTIADTTTTASATDTNADTNAGTGTGTGTGTDTGTGAGAGTEAGVRTGGDRATAERDTGSPATGAKSTAKAAGARTWWRRPPLPVVLGVLTVILGGFAVWSGQQAHALRGGTVARNVTLTDNARTSEVKGAVATAVNTIFSCDYADLAKTDSAARRLLTGKAVQQYNALFAPVRQRASKDKLVLTTTVTDSGVTMLQGDRARVLIFADQRNTRTVDDQTTFGGAMIAVNAVRKGGTWKIENIDTLTGTPPA